ncbi:MAG: hypothetical protein OXR68_05690 [Alphaproteobacteria bacterium]|nr:hypothetical protein [Alphaproteobacteria bacterium]MDD9920097.1 hypothetical protein [Alphaproteobacteria bacterium]
MNKLFIGALFASFLLLPFSHANELLRSKLEASCVKDSGGGSSEFCKCAVDQLFSKEMEEKFAAAKDKQGLREKVLADLAQDWSGNKLDLQELKDGQKLSDEEGLHFAFGLTMLAGCHHLAEMKVSIDTNVQLQSSEQSKKDGFAATPKVGNFKINLLLNGVSVSDRPAQIYNRTSKRNGVEKEQVVLKFNFDKTLLPKETPDKTWYFDVMIDGQKIGRTVSWSKVRASKGLNTQANADVIRVSHFFSEDEMSRLFRSMPLEGKHMKLTNGYVTFEGVVTD